MKLTKTLESASSFAARLFFYGYVKFIVRKKTKLTVTGLDNLTRLPNRRVLFLSNHETVMSEGMILLTILNKQKKCLFSSRNEVHFVGQNRNVKSGGLRGKLASICGMISFSRSWKEGENVDRTQAHQQKNEIVEAIDKDWLLLFPQGTTKDGAPFRKNTAKLYCGKGVWVVPIKVGGFRAAFKKFGFTAKAGSSLTIEFLKPVYYPKKEVFDVDYAIAADEISKIMDLKCNS